MDDLALEQIGTMYRVVDSLKQARSDAEKYALGAGSSEALRGFFACVDGALIRAKQELEGRTQKAYGQQFTMVDARRMR